ncbi:hypothetical protein [Chryseobacterium sp.]|jgi:hypothetical protein|uniref:hypothetical protein n=1 Tax=Chryseobacterium sp. TaxID=1871047 RepID=UPI002850CED4|nr:hypothetical protein [Chryseobacterium sp.]MDR3025941.1 hypothetical protein [Chryseobacterium sp.]
MKNKFIARLLTLVTIMVLLYSCRNELTSEQETYNNSSQFRPTSKTIRLDQSKHKLTLKAELQKANSSLQKIKPNLLGKTVDYSNIFIDTDNVTYIENGSNFYTYTFNLLRENAPENAPIENLVLAPKADGTYKEILVTYNLTVQEKQSILNGENISTKGKSYIMELNGNTFNPITYKSQSCSWVEADSYTWCSEGVHHNGEGSGSCTADVKSQIIKVMLLKCESIDDGSGNTGGGSNPGGSGEGGGNPGNPGSGGGTPTEPCNGTGIATGPLEPSTDIGDGTNCSGIPTNPTLSTFFIYVKKLPADLKAVINDTSNSEFYNGLKNYYDSNAGDEESKNFINWSLQFKQNNPSISWNEFWYNKYTDAPNSSIDITYNEVGNYDENTYENFDFENQQTQWPTINPIIAATDFIGWGAPGVRRNCMDYAKAQIAKNGYKVSNYYDVDSQGNKQTFQIYTEQGGVNLNDLYKGVSYLKYALSNGIPVIVGIDDKTGHPGNLDNSTDHFVVIVGMGTDSKGRYFRFYDNASGDVNQGTHPENKLYIKYPERIFTGKTQCLGYRADTEYDYIMTMIRKSK